MFEWFQQLFDQVSLIVRYIGQELYALVQLLQAFLLILQRAQLWFAALPPILTTVAILTVSLAIWFRILGR